MCGQPVFGLPATHTHTQLGDWFSCEACLASVQQRLDKFIPQERAILITLGRLHRFDLAVEEQAEGAKRYSCQVLGISNPLTHGGDTALDAAIGCIEQLVERFRESVRNGVECASETGVDIDKTVAGLDGMRRALKLLKDLRTLKEKVGG